MKKAVVGGAITMAAILSAPILFAQAPQPAQTELSASEVIAKLEAAGYTMITDLDKDDGVWEVEATNSAGQRVELDVHLVNGTVLREKPDDD